MSHLVEDLLPLARGDAQPLGVSEEKADLTALLRDVSERLAPAAAAKGLQLHATLPNESVPVSGVVSDLRRLFVILAENAIKYTDMGTATVSLEREQDGVNIRVSDTGIGIEDSALPHIFNRFWRADKVRSRTEGSVGLVLPWLLRSFSVITGRLPSKASQAKGSSFTVNLRKA
jgi:signal transduction histidine kinase